MEWVETTGRTIDEAKDAALDQLGVDETDAEFVIVSEPKAGLFGRMRGEARVRARVRPTSPRPKRGRSRRGSEQRGPQREGAGRGRGRTTTASGNDSGAGGRGRSETGVAVAERSAEGAAQATGGAGDNGTRPGGSSRRRRARPAAGSAGEVTGAERSEEPGDDQGRATTARASSARKRGSRASGETKEEPVGESLSVEEQGQAARQFVAGLVAELGMDAEVSTRLLDEETAEVAVDGPELGVLVGPGGATLAALQELARTYVQKQTGGHSSRIVVDVAGYRAKRAAALQRFAAQIAEEVASSGTEQALEPMSPADRKVVHDAINEIGGLTTRSVGEEPRRYIVIAPGGAAAEED